MNNYLKVSELDPELLEELNVNVENVQSGLEQKIMSLKDLYWRELFNNLTTITDKLTNRSRKKLLDTLFENTHLDFSAENAHGVVHWVIKNANSYFDEQLIDCHNSLTERANIILYKSNKKTFKDENWNYCRRPNDLDRYALDHRIVLHNAGGLATSSWSHENPDCGLSNRAITLLDDLCTIAINLNFDRTGQKTTTDFLWDTHIKNTFMFHDHVSNKEISLFEAKAFKNGNLHIKLNQDFICKLNVEFGRLKGWLSSAKEAAQEMDITEREAELSFNTNALIEASKFKNVANSSLNIKNSGKHECFLPLFTQN
ncbi:DUF4942 domain-containing protein [Psychromonas sp. KJ10-2]|uniref:DUF4942 domain-containing protein n=1 Tax=Psychromonas sp. KJ10-2 TaxID=3391822 RepID=UPI0039B6C478